MDKLPNPICGNADKFYTFWGGFKSRMTQLPSLDPFIPSSVLSDHTAWKKNFEKNKIEKAFNPKMLKRTLKKIQYTELQKHKCCANDWLGTY